MNTKTVWRTDDRNLNIGSEMLRKKVSPIDWVEGAHQSTENFIQENNPRLSEKRSKSLYTWENHDVAVRSWELQLKHGYQCFLYTLEVDSRDLLHAGDLNHYTDIGLLVGKVGPFSAPLVPKHIDAETALRRYADGSPRDEPRHKHSQVEILVRKALVVEVVRP